MADNIVGRAAVEVRADTKNLKKDIEKDFSKALKDDAKNTAKSVLTLTKGVVALGAAVTAIAIKGGISRALNIEDARAKLKGLGHDAQNVEKIMDSALASVKGTAFGLDAAATAAASAVAAGVEPGEELTRVLSLTGDAATIMGRTFGESGAIINKVLAGNRLGMEEVNQLLDAGLPILSMLAEQFGVTALEMREMVSEGKVGSEEFLKAIEENIGGAALASGETTRGAFANMMAAINRFGEGLVKDLLPVAKMVFEGIGTGFDTLSTKVKPFIDDFVASDAFAKLKDNIENIPQLFEDAVEWVKNFWEESEAVREQAGQIALGIVGIFDAVKNMVGIDAALWTSQFGAQLTLLKAHPVIGTLATIAQLVGVIQANEQRATGDALGLTTQLQHLSNVDAGKAFRDWLNPTMLEQMQRFGVNTQTVATLIRDGKVGTEEWNTVMGPFLSQFDNLGTAIFNTDIQGFLNAVGQMPGVWLEAVDATRTVTSATEQNNEQIARQIALSGTQKEAIESVSNFVRQEATPEMIASFEAISASVEDEAGNWASSLTSFGSVFDGLPDQIDTTGEKMLENASAIRAGVEENLRLVLQAEDMGLDDVAQLIREEGPAANKAAQDLLADADLAGALETELDATQTAMEEGVSKWASGKIQTEASNAGINLGTDVGQGVAQGITNSTPFIQSAIRRAINSAKNEARVVMKAQSPSRVFADEVGAPMSEGVAEGILESMDAPVGAVRELMDRLIDAAQTGVNAVFGALSAVFSKQDAQRNLADTKREVISLQNELKRMPQTIAQISSQLTKARAAASKVTAEETVNIERATENLARLRASVTDVSTAEKALAAARTARTQAQGELAAAAEAWDYNAFVAAQNRLSEAEREIETQQRALDQARLNKASAAEIKLAEEQLTAAKKAAKSPTQQVRDLEQQLADARARHKELPKEIAEATRDQTRAELQLVNTHYRLLEAANELNESGRLDLFKRMAKDAGLASSSIAKLAKQLIGLPLGLSQPKVAAGAPKPPAATSSLYTVKRGDTLRAIANQFGSTWQKIYDLNKAVIGGNPDLIRIGQILKIPNRQMGGTGIKGHPYITGEDGPELFVPNMSGKFISNDRMGKMMGPRIDSLMIDMTFTSPVTPEMAKQAGQEAARAALDELSMASVVR